MVSKKLQIFVSSTYLDMKEERQAAVEAILESGHIPAGMELFAADNQTQWQTIEQWIDDSDALVLLLGGRYGSVSKETSKSYTHMEFEYAQSKNKPVFGIVLEDSTTREKEKRLGGDKVWELAEGAKYKQFRKMVLSQMCKLVGNCDQVKLAAFQAITNFERKAGPDSGWIRAKDVVEPKALVQQIDALQAENLRLRQNSSVADDPIEKLRETLRRDILPVPMEEPFGTLVDTSLLDTVKNKAVQLAFHREIYFPWTAENKYSIIYIIVALTQQGFGTFSAGILVGDEEDREKKWQRYSFYPSETGEKLLLKLRLEGNEAGYDN